MRVLYFALLFLLASSCATKKDSKKLILADDIKSATEEIYIVVNNQKKLLQRKEMNFTRNGRIKYSKTTDSLGNLLQETEKRLWFIKQTYLDKKTHYCKIRWKTKQRERISCYTNKRYKQNESIYHYNEDGTINKIADNFSPFYTQYFYYTSNEMSKIVIKDKNGSLIDEVLINCILKDDKGACLKQLTISSKSKIKKEVLLFPNYR